MRVWYEKIDSKTCEGPALILKIFSFFLTLIHAFN